MRVTVVIVYGNLYACNADDMMFLPRFIPSLASLPFHASLSCGVHVRYPSCWESGRHERRERGKRTDWQRETGRGRRIISSIRCRDRNMGFIIKMIIFRGHSIPFPLPFPLFLCLLSFLDVYIFSISLLTLDPLLWSLFFLSFLSPSSCSVLVILFRWWCRYSCRVLPVLLQSLSLSSGKTRHYTSSLMLSSCHVSTCTLLKEKESERLDMRHLLGMNMSSLQKSGLFLSLSSRSDRDTTSLLREWWLWFLYQKYSSGEDFSTWRQK